MAQPVSWLVRQTVSHSLLKWTFTNTSELRQCSHHEGQAELASMSEMGSRDGGAGLSKHEDLQQANGCLLPGIGSLTNQGSEEDNLGDSRTR